MAAAIGLYAGVDVCVYFQCKGTSLGKENSEEITL